MLPNVPLPEDFLRLRVPATIPSPHVSSVGNRSDTTKTHDEVNRIEDAEAKQGHSNNMTYSIVIVKETEVGSLGMTIRDSYIRRPGLGIDGSLPFQPTKEYHGDTAVVVTDFKSDQSPTRLAGVEVGDVLHSVNDHSVHTVRNAVEIIRNCPILSLLKLNFVRGIQYQLYSSDENTTTSQLKNVKSVGGKVLNESLEKDCFVYPGNRINQKGNVERPALASTTNGVKKLKRRPIHPVYHLLNRHKMLLPAHTSADQVFRFTSMLNNFQIYQENVGYTRQPLIIRILHTFKDPESKEDENSYTIWVADVYTGKEWYAPARKYSDFVELRSHLTNLRGEIGNYSLEKPRALPIFQAKTSDRERMDLLEAFLRSVCLLLYTRTSEGSEESCFLEVAFHLRSFLGCDEVVNKMSPSRSQRVGSPSKKMKVLDLHRSTQLYVYLVLNIPPFQDIISKFIKDRRSSAEEIFKAAERGNMIASEWTQWLKSVSKAEMKRVQSCLDQLTNMVLEGCDEGFKTILESHDVSNSESSTTAIAEAVRELVEYEVYVPLRRVLSKLLVNAFSNDDSQIYYRIEVCNICQSTLLNNCELQLIGYAEET